MTVESSLIFLYPILDNQ